MPGAYMVLELDISHPCKRACVLFLYIHSENHWSRRMFMVDSNLECHLCSSLNEHYKPIFLKCPPPLTCELPSLSFGSMFSRQNTYSWSSREWFSHAGHWFHEATGFFPPERPRPGWQGRRLAVPCCEHAHQRAAGALEEWERGATRQGWPFQLERCEGEKSALCAQQRKAQVTLCSTVFLLPPFHQCFAPPSFAIPPNSLFSTVIPSPLRKIHTPQMPNVFSCLLSFHCNCSESVLLLEAFSFYHIIMGNSLM